MEFSEDTIHLNNSPNYSAPRFGLSSTVTSSSSPTASDKLFTFYAQAVEKLCNRFPGDQFNIFNPQSDFIIDFQHIHLKEQLAQGAFGVVYTAYMKGKKYAVKIEDLSIGVESQVNVLSELTVLQSLSHLHERLVGFIGAGNLIKSPTEAKVMVVMELCENGALRDRIYDTDMSWPLVTRLALDVADGLQFLHSYRLIHRDIKTTNILIDTNWRAKICDFSFSLEEAEDSCRGGRQDFVYGTAEFMAPEVALGEDFSVASDIFSFGVVLCEMICKIEPSEEFLHREAKAFFAMNYADLQQAVPSDCPDSLEILILHCCDTDPAKRPTAQDCIEWLLVIFEKLEREGGAETYSTLPDQSTDISVPLGVMASRREGLVKPRVLQGHDMPESEYQVEGDNYLCLDERKEEVLTPELFQEMCSRIKFLEIQSQELRSENRSLTKELTAMQRDYLTRSLSPSSPTLKSLEGSDFMSRSNYQSRILHPGSPAPSPVAGIKLQRGGSGPTTPKSDSASSYPNEVLVQKMLSMEKLIESLSSDLEQLKQGEKSSNAMDENLIPFVVSGNRNISKPDRARSRTTEIYRGNIENKNKNVDNSSTQVENIGITRQNITTRTEMKSSVQNKSSVEFSASSQSSGIVDAPDDSNASSLSKVVDSFLSVVEKCSAVKKQSQKTLSDIDQEKNVYRKIVDANPLFRIQNTESGERVNEVLTSPQTRESRADSSRHNTAFSPAESRQRTSPKLQTDENIYIQPVSSFLSQTFSPKAKQTNKVQTKFFPSTSPTHNNIKNNENSKNDFDFTSSQLKASVDRTSCSDVTMTVQELLNSEPSSARPLKKPQHLQERGRGNNIDNYDMTPNPMYSSNTNSGGAFSEQHEHYPEKPPSSTNQSNNNRQGNLKKRDATSNKSSSSVSNSNKYISDSQAGSRGKIKSYIEPNPEDFFKPDHLYQYVFGRESNKQSKSPTKSYSPASQSSSLSSFRNESQAVKHQQLGTSTDVASIGTRHTSPSQFDRYANVIGGRVYRNSSKGVSNNFVGSDTASSPPKSLNNYVNQNAKNISANHIF